MNGLFITGTDTNVGKTFAACKIAETLVLQGINVKPRKPVESGCQLIGSELIADDALKLQQACQSDEALEIICPHRFQQAISPARAAQLNNQIISIEELTQACTTQVKENDFLLVEGAGGFYSPICKNALNADLAQALNLPVLLVSENRVGTINQVLLCLSAIKQKKLSVKAIVLNQICHTDKIDNITELSQLTHLPIFLLDGKNSSIEEIINVLSCK